MRVVFEVNETITDNKRLKKTKLQSKFSEQNRLGIRAQKKAEEQVEVRAEAIREEIVWEEVRRF